MRNKVRKLRRRKTESVSVNCGISIIKESQKKASKRNSKLARVFSKIFVNKSVDKHPGLWIWKTPPHHTGEETKGYNSSLVTRVYWELVECRNEDGTVGVCMCIETREIIITKMEYVSNAHARTHTPIPNAHTHTLFVQWIRKNRWTVKRHFYTFFPYPHTHSPNSFVVIFKPHRRETR